MFQKRLDFMALHSFSSASQTLIRSIKFSAIYLWGIHTSSIYLLPYIYIYLYVNGSKQFSSQYHYRQLLIFDIYQLYSVIVRPERGSSFTSKLPKWMQHNLFHKPASVLRFVIILLQNIEHFFIVFLNFRT